MYCSEPSSGCLPPVFRQQIVSPPSLRKGICLDDFSRRRDHENVAISANQKVVAEWRNHKRSLRFSTKEVGRVHNRFEGGHIQHHGRIWPFRKYSPPAVIPDVMVLIAFCSLCHISPRVTFRYGNRKDAFLRREIERFQNLGVGKPIEMFNSLIHGQNPHQSPSCGLAIFTSSTWPVLTSTRSTFSWLFPFWRRLFALITATPES